MKVLVTGGLGFIGFHTAKRLIETGHDVLIVDRLHHKDDYYDYSIKASRLDVLIQMKTSKKYDFEFINADINNDTFLPNYIKDSQIDVAVHLAAHAGFRNGDHNFDPLMRDNVIGFHNILKMCTDADVKHFIFLSTIWAAESNHITNSPMGRYITSKRIDESIARMAELPITCLRFHTVYGEYGRPDMVVYRYVDALYKAEPIFLFDYGRVLRDYIHVFDVTECILKAITTHKANTYNAYNVGTGVLTDLNALSMEIQSITGIDFTERRFIPVPVVEPNVVTVDDITEYFNTFGYHNFISLHDGLVRFIDWYKTYNMIKECND